jgi:hypothetical protein
MVVACVALAIGLAGCVSKYKTDTFAGPEDPLTPAGGFYVMLAPNGSYGARVYPNSGRTTTQAVAAALSIHAEKVEIADRIRGLKKALARAKTFDLKYLFRPQILNWEDRATAWSGRPDRITLQFSIYDELIGKRLVNSTMRASSKWATFGGDHPQDLVPVATKRFVDRLF